MNIHLYRSRQTLRDCRFGVKTGTKRTIAGYVCQQTDTERRNLMNVENTIMRTMADILCQQHLITPDEKSRLILLIDEERE